MAVTRILTDGIANTAISRIDGDLTLVGAAANVLWDKSADDLIFADNAGAVFGTGNDLKIYHDGSHSFVHDTGTGSLHLAGINATYYDADLHTFRSGDAGETMASFTDNGAVSLYYDNSAKLATTSGGVNITGTSTDDGANHDGDVIFYGASYDVTWDKSDNRMEFGDNALCSFGASEDLTLKHDGTNSYITNTTGALKIATETSGIAVTIGHTTSETTVADNLTVTGTTSISGIMEVTKDQDIDHDIGRSTIGTFAQDWATFSHIDHSSIAATAFRQSPAGKTEVNSASGQAIAFRVGNNDKMYMDSSGNFGIGTTSPGALFHSYTTSNDGTLKHEATGGNGIILIAGNRTSNASVGSLVFYNNAGSANIGQIITSRRDADNGGEMLFYTSAAGTMTQALQIQVDQMLRSTQANASTFGYRCIQNHASAPIGLDVSFGGCAPDNNTQYFYRAIDTSAVRMYVMSDGDLQNHDNAYGSSSDERIKEGIRDANSQWNDIKALKIRNFKKKDDVRQYGDNAWEQLGVVAQELEKTSPKLIRHRDPDACDILSDSSFGTIYTADDDIPSGKEIGEVKSLSGEKVKSVQYSILYMKAVKALQEAMARIETLEAKVTALEG